MDKKFFRGILTDELETAKVTLTSIAYDEGCSCGKGASLAPDRIRELSSFLPPLTMDGKLIDDIKIYDFGNIEKTSNYFEKIKEEAENRLEMNKFPIFIGGDHSITIPLQEAFFDYCKKTNKIPAIIHLDAHPDICDFYDGSKLSHACTNKRSIDYGYKTENIILIGIRGFEKEEVEYLDCHKELRVYTANECYNYGIQNIVNDLKNKFSDQYAVYLSYDIDINDPSFAPGTGTPEAFGLSSRMVLELIMGLFENLNIKAFDIVEVSPTLDCNDITSWLALKTLYEVLNILKEKL